jgi:hypothetical protein
VPVHLRGHLVVAQRHVGVRNLAPVVLVPDVEVPDRRDPARNELLIGSW